MLPIDRDKLETLLKPEEVQHKVSGRQAQRMKPADPVGSICDEGLGRILLVQDGVKPSDAVNETVAQECAPLRNRSFSP